MNPTLFYRRRVSEREREGKKHHSCPRSGSASPRKEEEEIAFPTSQKGAACEEKGAADPLYKNLLFPYRSFVVEGKSLLFFSLFRRERGKIDAPFPRRTGPDEGERGDGDLSFISSCKGKEKEVPISCIGDGSEKATFFFPLSSGRGKTLLYDRRCEKKMPLPPEEKGKPLIFKKKAGFISFSGGGGEVTG